MHPPDAEQVAISVRRIAEQESRPDPQIAVTVTDDGSALCIDVDHVSLTFDMETVRTFPELLPAMLRRHLRANRVA